MSSNEAATSLRVMPPDRSWQPRLQTESAQSWGLQWSMHHSSVTPCSTAIEWHVVSTASAWAVFGGSFDDSN